MKIEIIKKFNPEQMAEQKAKSRTANDEVYEQLKKTEINGGFEFEPEATITNIKTFVHALRVYLGKKKDMKATVKSGKDSRVITVTLDALNAPAVSGDQKAA